MYFYLKNVDDGINKKFKLFEKYIKECKEEEQASGVILFDVLTEKKIRNLNDFYENFKESFPVLWKYFYFVHDFTKKKKKKKNVHEYIENGRYTFLDITMGLELLVTSIENKDYEDSDSEEDGEICFHCQ